MNLGLGLKRVFITGSTQGIGKAIAEAMLSEGAMVVINGRNREKMNSVLCELKKRFPGGIIDGICGDITDEKDLEKCTSHIADHWGKLDVLICTVGSGKAVCTDALNLREWEHMIKINLLSVVGTIHKFERLVCDGGSVVTVSSIAAREVIGAPIAYAASKEAVVVFTKYLSKQLASRNIRINCVMPGNIFFEGGRWEELSRNDKAGVETYIDESVPLKRFGTPEEVADSVLFLASYKSSFTTGSVLVVDGGQISAIG